MDPTNANTALASAFAEELARCGVRQAVISPGSRSTPLAVALWREPEIETTVIVDERSAGFFALGAAQASRTPVAILCTSGTAAANLHPAVCEADLSAIPLLLLTADRPPELRAIGAGQTIDQIKLYGSSVRWFCEVGTHDADDSGLLHYRSTACRAVAAARGEPRPGPVHLNLAWREPLAPVKTEDAVTASDPLALDGRGERPLTAVTPHEAAPSQFLLDEVAGHIERAKSGVIVAGRQLDRRLREPLARLARAAGMPILAEPTSQLRCGPHDRSCVVTAYDLLLRDEAFAESVAPDLVLRFGEMPTSKPLRNWLAGPAVQQIVIDPLAGWNEPSRRAAALLRADPVRLSEGWAARLDGERPAPAIWLDAERAAREAIESELDAEALPSEPGLQQALASAYRDGDLVYTSSSMPIRDQEAFLPSAETDVLFLSNRGANGIDGLVSSGIGAAHASGRPTTIITGDLGLLHDVGGLAALRDVSVPVRIVVIDNDGGGIFHFLPQESVLGRDEFEALLGTPRGVDASKAAALFDLSHRHLSSLDDLTAALTAGTGLIEVPVDRRTNVALHRRLAERVAAAVSR
ncbi:MAG TPA: 2-succinyl-5-enolpyruvyl-6-hydroxy-3-cyclohexene-1-carboxylic-acid synthase [Solirubrobacterales bacterium]|nr:2-succinyl-5-enolpyruvyl-6-hydroxy-3-cyclohexene-1-carboxylic-acid synthase [Solirubrobacterales bacterium]